MQIEAVGEVVRGFDREPRVDVDRSLRPPGRARGVDNHVRVIGRGRLGRAVARGVRDGFVPPDVALRRERDVLSRVPEDEAASHARGGGDRLVGNPLHRHRFAPAVRAIGRDQHRRFAVAEPGGDRLRAESGEHRQVDRAELAASEGRDRRLRQHRQEDADPVPFADTERPQGIRETVRLDRQLTVGQLADRPVVPLPDQRELIAPQPVRVAVDGIVDIIEPTAGEPLGPGDAGRQIEHTVIRRGPNEVEIAHDGVPVPGRVGRGALKQSIVGIDPRRGDEPAEAAPFKVLLRRAPDDSVVIPGWRRSVTKRSHRQPPRNGGYSVLAAAHPAGDRHRIVASSGGRGQAIATGISRRNDRGKRGRRAILCLTPDA